MLSFIFSDSGKEHTFEVDGQGFASFESPLYQNQEDDPANFDYFHNLYFGDLME